MEDPYALAVNKHNYQNAESLEHNLFYIPPIPNLLRLTGSEEFHHARTKVSSLSESMFSFGSGEGCSDQVMEKIGKQPFFIANNLDPAIHERELRKLVHENYFKTPSLIAMSGQLTFFGFNFSNYKHAKKMTEGYQEEESPAYKIPL